MELKDLKLARWFKNRLATIMEHNEDYCGSFTRETCSVLGLWTPTDLIIREWLNNGGGSAKGFLGLTRTQCKECFYYICENKQYFIDNDLVNKDGWNNSGFPLWKDYNF